jgi:hypothetical protein
VAVISSLQRSRLFAALGLAPRGWLVWTTHACL